MSLGLSPDSPGSEPRRFVATIVSVKVDGVMKEQYAALKGVDKTPLLAPTKPLGSYHANRHLHGWILPPLEICTFAAHR